MKGMRGFILLAALALAGSAAAYLIPAGISAVTGTTTQTTTLDVGTGDFTYDGQTVPVSSWPNMGNLAFVKWVRTPLHFDCAPGTLAVTDKTTYAQEQNTLTFAPPAGSVIVGVLVKSGSSFDFIAAAWAEDGSAATVTITQGFSGTAVFYCNAAAPVGTTTVLTTTVGTTTIVTTITLPGTTTTAPGATTTLSGTTITLPGATTTLPGTTITLPGTTTTLPGATTTLAGATTTVRSAPLTPPKAAKAKKAKKKKVKAKRKTKSKPKVTSHKRPKVTG
jgi:hypothetical protein